MYSFTRGNYYRVVFKHGWYLNKIKNKPTNETPESYEEAELILPKVITSEIENKSKDKKANQADSAVGSNLGQLRVDLTWDLSWGVLLGHSCDQWEGDVGVGLRG